MEGNKQEQKTPTKKRVWDKDDWASLITSDPSREIEMAGITVYEAGFHVLNV